MGNMVEWLSEQVNGCMQYVHTSCSMLCMLNGMLGDQVQICSVHTCKIKQAIYMRMIWNNYDLNLKKKKILKTPRIQTYNLNCEKT